MEGAVSDLDFLDPNNWVFNNHEFRIYADDYANDYALVDQEDYSFLIQWRWKPKTSKVHKGTKKPKIYLCRSVSEILGEDTYAEDGKRIRNRYTQTLYLHEVVMERSGKSKPKTNKKLIIDHANGDGFDCRRRNLRWATISFNNKNVFGSHELEMDLDLG